MSEYAPLLSDDAQAAERARDEAAQGTLLSSIANLSNTILGGGMLAMSHAVCRIDWQIYASSDNLVL